MIWAIASRGWSLLIDTCLLVKSADSVAWGSKDCTALVILVTQAPQAILGIVICQVMSLITSENSLELLSDHHRQATHAASRNPLIT
jgi:hypothetical protein